MSSGSVSEGEITESKIEKATTTPSTDIFSSVNRKLREALSPSPEASRTSSTSSASNDRPRYRSRSPYRSHRPGRGGKRNHDEESVREIAEHDPRRFKVHYEDRHIRRYDDLSREHSYSQATRYEVREERRGDNSVTGYDDREERAGHSKRMLHNDREQRDRNRDKRQRTYSRSPVRQQRHDHRLQPTTKSISVDHSAKYGGRKNDAGHGVADRQDRTGTLKAHFVPQQTANAREVSNVRQTNSNGPLTMAATIAKQQSDHTSIVTVADTAPDVPKLTELSIEERRRRRLEIQAKFKNASVSPLPVLTGQFASTPVSPASPSDTIDSASSRQGSPALDSPGYSHYESAAASPPQIRVSHDAELANRSKAPDIVIDSNEQSAFDYDPTMDMEADRYKIDTRFTGEEISASTYDETKVELNQEMLPSEVMVDVSGQMAEKQNELKEDMFASGDEDDMFAPAPVPKKSSLIHNGSQVAANLKGKTLDQSLLDNWDDKDGYYRVIVGELLEDRYNVLAILGKGVFSGVIRATDTVMNRLVAIKIIRNSDAMVQAALKEIDILQRLADADPDDKKHIIRLERSFNHKGHFCMVFEHFSLDLRNVLQKFGRDVGINLTAIRSYAQQMFVGLNHLRKCNILHADLKPDNILVNEARSLLKICDLGSAAEATGGSEITPYLVSRFYRAPEIMLGMNYDFALDMWSIGCTLYELYTGKILFTGRTNNQMLRSIMECRGKFSLKMLKKGEFSGDHFDDQNLNFRSREIDKITGREVVKLINIAKPIKDLKSRLLIAAGVTSTSSTLHEGELKDLNLFADLLDKCLALNPEKRITPLESLKHPFIYRPALAFGFSR